MRLIDADALKAEFDYSGDVYVSEVVEQIDNAPTVEERKATWSEVIATNVEHDGVIRHFCCSYCGRVVSVLYPQELGLLYPYCHCGAKMEVEE